MIHCHCLLVGIYKFSFNCKPCGLDISTPSPTNDRKRPFSLSFGCKKIFGQNWNHLSWTSAHLQQPIIKRGENQILPEEKHWYFLLLISNLQQGVCVWFRFCLFIRIYWKDNFLMSLSRFFRHRLPSSTSAADLGAAVVIQLLLLEVGPNNSLQTLWNRFDSIDLTLACEDTWVRCQPGPSKTREFTMDSFEDTSKQWGHHWCAPGLRW